MKNEVISTSSIGSSPVLSTPGFVNNGLLVGENTGNINTTTYSSDIFRTYLQPGFVGRRDCYSILICDYDDDNAFVLRYSSLKTAFEEKRTPEKLITKFTPFTEDKIKALLRVPALVMKPDKSKSPSGKAMLGYLVSIEGTMPKQMRFFLLTQFPVSAIVSHFDVLQIKHSDLWSELHEERWNIKEGNIFELLEQVGINPPIL